MCYDFDDFDLVIIRLMVLVFDELRVETILPSMQAEQNYSTLLVVGLSLPLTFGT